MDDATRKGHRAALENETTPRLLAIVSGPFEEDWQPEARAVAAELLAERGVEPGPSLDVCPACGGELVAGAVSVHGTVGGLLAVGLSYQHCWFRSSETGDEEVVVAWRESRSARRCADCGTLLVAG